MEEVVYSSTNHSSIKRGSHAKAPSAGNQVLMDLIKNSGPKQNIILNGMRNNQQQSFKMGTAANGAIGIYSTTQ
jgi:hypothetical protein